MTCVRKQTITEKQFGFKNEASREKFLIEPHKEINQLSVPAEKADFTFLWEPAFGIGCQLS